MILGLQSQIKNIETINMDSFNTCIAFKANKPYWVQRFLQLIDQCTNGSSLFAQVESLFLSCGVCDLQHSMGFEAACRETVLPLGWLMCTRNTSRTRVFLRPMSVSPLRSSMSELRSFRIPAQSILQQRQDKSSHFKDASMQKRPAYKYWMVLASQSPMLKY